MVPDHGLINLENFLGASYKYFWKDPGAFWLVKVVGIADVKTVRFSLRIISHS